MPSMAETSAPAYGMTLLATAAVGLLAAGAQRTLKVARQSTTHGIKFSYSIQKDAYADLEFMNDVGCLETTSSKSTADFIGGSSKAFFQAALRIVSRHMMVLVYLMYS